MKKTHGIVFSILAVAGLLAVFQWRVLFNAKHQPSLYNGSAGTQAMTGSIPRDIKTEEHKKELRGSPAFETPEARKELSLRFARTRKPRDATNELKEPSSGFVTGDDQRVPDTGKVIARIGKRQITESEINEAIAGMPEWMKKDLQDDARKKQFIRDYIATEVLYAKAKTLGLDKAEPVTTALKDAEKQLVLQQLVEKEFKDKMAVSEQEIEHFYSTHQERFVRPEAVKIAYIELKDENKKAEAVLELGDGNGVRVGQWIEDGDTYIPGLGEAPEIIHMLMKEDKNGVAGPVLINNVLYMFLLTDKRGPVTMPFTEARSDAETELLRQKQEAILNTMLDKALEEETVEIIQ
ncbi:MAG: peptidylprolyl isomerase [Candidatus Omnitrophica bacterium]|nr:peptidylprolyl isomerase [Candidatus Omnitrophota bacterium]